MLAFYKRFLESPNFTAWFERQREAAWAWQEAEWTAAAAARGEGADLSGLDEVQVGYSVQHPALYKYAIIRTCFCPALQVETSCFGLICWQQHPY